MSPSNPLSMGKLAEADRWILVCILFFTILLVAISKWSPADGQTFQVIAQLDTGFAAAFLTRLTGSEKPKQQQTNIGTTVNATEVKES